MTPTIALSILLSATSVSAAAKRSTSQVTARAGVGMAVRANTLLSTLELALDGRYKGASIGVQLPLQMQLLSASPGGANDDRGVRAKDWDERAEWLRFLHRAAWRWQDRSTGRASLVIAPLAGATLGHGAIVRRYHGTLRSDHFKSGARASWDLHSWGGDLLTDDVTAARIIAGRIFMRPFAAERGGLARTFTIGATAAVDRSAPIAAHTDRFGRRSYSQQGYLQASRGTVIVAGIDLGAEVVRNFSLSLVPYADLNFSQLPTGTAHAATGMCASAGLRAALWPFDGDRGLTARFELRTFDGVGSCAYFDSMYEVEQERWLANGLRRTKVEALLNRPFGVSTGQLLEVAGRYRKMRLVASVELFEQPGFDTASLWLDMPFSNRTRARLMVSRRRFSGLSDIARNGQWTAAASIKAAAVKAFDVFVAVQNAWHVAPQAHAGLSTTFDAVVGLSLSNVL